MIKDIETVNGKIPLTPTVPEQLWVEEWSNQLFTKVETEDFTGWGETLPSAANSREPFSAVIRQLKASLINRDESEIRKIWEVMRRATFSGGYGITTGAISGIDIALWDILGKKNNLPLFALLGGSKEKIGRYASLSRYGNNADAVAAVGNLLNSGYRKIKLHQSKDSTLDAMKQIRENYGYGFDLMADLNCTMEYGRAREFVSRAVKYEPLWIEEPLWPPDDFKSLERLNRIAPIAAGENAFSVQEFRRLLEIDALSYYQPDITKVGGITPMLDILSLLKINGANVAFHNRPHNGWIGIMASVHMAAALNADYIIETPPNEIPDYLEFNGSMDKSYIVPSGPGIGIEPKQDIPVSSESKLLKFSDF